MKKFSVMLLACVLGGFSLAGAQGTTVTTTTVQRSATAPMPRHMPGQMNGQHMTRKVTCRRVWRTNKMGKRSMVTTCQQMRAMPMRHPMPMHK